MANLQILVPGCRIGTYQLTAEGEQQQKNSNQMYQLVGVVGKHAADFSSSVELYKIEINSAHSGVDPAFLEKVFPCFS